MPRFIIIDRNSGYIWGDTADFAFEHQSDLDPIAACRLLDESLGEHGREYEETGRHDAAAGYDVYQNRSTGDAVPVVHDGQDPDTIAAVEAACEHVATVRYTAPSL